MSSCSQTGPEIKASQPVEMGIETHPDPWSSGEGVKGLSSPGRGQARAKQPKASSLLSTCSVSEGSPGCGECVEGGQGWEGDQGYGSADMATLNHEQPDEL